MFTDEDRLRLLHLMTRRAMAERRDREGRRQEGADSESNQESQEPLATVIPQRWRLVPEGVTLYDWQRECLPLWLRTGRGTIKVATGGGKTLFALAAAQQLQNEREHDLRLVVVVPTIPLMFQWHDEVRRGNLPGSAIGLMGGGQEVPSLSGLRVLICVLNSARDRLPALVEKAGWPRRMLLVVDECHRSNADQARKIFDARPKYALGLSATPEQDMETEAVPTNDAYENSVVGQALGPIIYDFTIQQSLAAGLLTPFEVWHIGLPLSAPEASDHARLSREITELRKGLQLRHRNSHSRQGFIAWCQTQASRGGPASVEAGHFIDLANRRKRLLYRAKARIQVALGLLSESVNDPDARTIVFHEAIDEIESLFLQATSLGIPAVLEHSQLPPSLRAESIDAFRRGIARAIISAKSLVEGFNVPSADLGIILASSSSVRQRIQSLGRMLRRKSGGREARIVVLYVLDTEDEAIYEKADWETVIGAKRNRYFLWHTVQDNESWNSGLTEAPAAPRSYRPPSWEIDVRGLNPGDPYPGQAHGNDLRVDQSGNLRTDDGVLVEAPREYVEMIVERNLLRRARCTPAGHLITRVDQRDDAADWRFVGTVKLPDEPDGVAALKLRIRTASGRRHIALEDDRRRRIVRYALGPGRSRTPEGGQARDKLLEWIRREEHRLGFQGRDLFWDKSGSYWLEVEGQRIPYEGELAPLEFEP